tara:strand:- start:54 stop:500 length:447 start_codon:yes stop_codon:yes gene_type:complete
MDTSRTQPEADRANTPAGVRFAPDRSTYLRAQAWLAALAVAGAVVVLWAMDSPYVWTGAVGALAAIGLRGWFLGRDEMNTVWELQGDTLTGPGTTRIHLDNIETIKTMGHIVQIVTKDGMKHLIRYQSDPKAVIERLSAAHRSIRGVA